MLINVINAQREIIITKSRDAFPVLYNAIIAKIPVDAKYAICTIVLTHQILLVIATYAINSSVLNAIILINQCVIAVVRDIILTIILVKLARKTALSAQRKAVKNAFMVISS